MVHSSFVGALDRKGSWVRSPFKNHPFAFLGWQVMNQDSHGLKTLWIILATPNTSLQGSHHLQEQLSADQFEGGGHVVLLQEELPTSPGQGTHYMTISFMASTHKCTRTYGNWILEWWFTKHFEQSFKSDGMFEYMLDPSWCNCSTYCSSSLKSDDMSNTQVLGVWCKQAAMAVRSLCIQCM